MYVCAMKGVIVFKYLYTSYIQTTKQIFVTVISCMWYKSTLKVHVATLVQFAQALLEWLVHVMVQHFYTQCNKIC